MAPIAARRPTVSRPLRRITKGIVFGLSVILAVSISPAAAAAPNAWTAVYGDAGNATNNAGETTISVANASRVGKAWTSTQRSAAPTPPAVVGGVAYRVVSTTNVADPSQFTAASPRTGATLWTVRLPGNAQYHGGVTVSGSIAVASFTGYRRPGGVVAVNLQTRRVIWTKDLPAARISWMGNSTAGTPYTDGSRVYVDGAGNAINAFRLSDGARLWTVPLATYADGRPKAVSGMAVAAGVVYTGGDEGIVAYSGSSGRRLWTANASGRPVIAGGRVFGFNAGSVVAFPAAGCGRSVCSALWARPIAGLSPGTAALGGADASTLFLTYRQDVPPPPGGVTGSSRGIVARLSAASGAIQWSAAIGWGVDGLVRAGNAVWFVNTYVDSAGRMSERIAAFSTTANGSTPLRTIPLAADERGFPQSLSVASGTLFHQTWRGGYLHGYRVPGT